jgi:signal transduction histidine kinase
MLEPWDRDWVNAGMRRSVSYTGIPAGRYRFRVAVSNGWNTSTLSEAALSIVVRPYFYETAWFLSLCLATLILAIVIIHNYRVSQIAAHLNDRLQERLEERTRIARELHDTLLQGVIGMLMQLYAIETQIAEESPVKAGLARVVGRAHRLVDEGRITLEDLRSEATHENALEEAIARSIDDFDVPDTVQVHVTVAGVSQPLNSVVQDDAYRIAREAFTNALKHSQATTIAIEIAYSDSALKVRVWDNGQGIVPDPGDANRSGHWGIQGMRERAVHIGGQLKLWSRPGEGTEVGLRIPSRLAYLSGAQPRPLQFVTAWILRRHADVMRILGMGKRTED